MYKIKKSHRVEKTLLFLGDDNIFQEKISPSFRLTMRKFRDRYDQEHLREMILM